MDSYMLDETLQVLFDTTLPLSRSQTERIRELCVGVLLAGNIHLSRIARWLKQDTHQDSRVQWIRRLLGTEFMTQARVYTPFVQRVLSQFKSQRLHVIMDRTPLVANQTDVLSVSLSFRHRALPLVWELMPHGKSDTNRQQHLLTACRSLLPAQCAVVFHGDNEFGSVHLLQHLQQWRWDFIVGQSCKNYYRCSPTGNWQVLASLPVRPSQPVYLSRIELTKEYGYGPLNLFAFYQPHYNRGQSKHDITYCATSLPITPALRRLGQRRWGIECTFKDFKSAGWQVQASGLIQEPRWEGFLNVLSVIYLWTTCLGRWLCKTANRQLVDAQPQRHLSLFRLGWDWLVHRYRMGLTCPALLTLYQ